METEPSRLDWTVSEVAAWFNVSTRTVWRWMSRDDNPLPFSRPAGGRARFNSTQVKEWGDSNT